MFLSPVAELQASSRMWAVPFNIYRRRPASLLRQRAPTPAPTAFNHLVACELSGFLPHYQITNILHPPKLDPSPSLDPFKSGTFTPLSMSTLWDDAYQIYTPQVPSRYAVQPPVSASTPPPFFTYNVHYWGMALPGCYMARRLERASLPSWGDLNRAGSFKNCLLPKIAKPMDISPRFKSLNTGGSFRNYLSSAHSRNTVERIVQKFENLEDHTAYSMSNSFTFLVMR